MGLQRPDGRPSPRRPAPCGRRSTAASRATKRALRLALLSGSLGIREAALPPFSPALRDALWHQAEREVSGLSPSTYSANEHYVCATGNWGDGPQCDQWDRGRSPCWPSALTVAASWDVDLMAHWSAEMAQEFGVPGRGQLGPGINLARFAWNGRVGEYMSGEDPYFGARMVEAMVWAYRQSPGAPPLQTAKHFIANTIEVDRMGMTEVVDERTLFEVYYPPFLAAVEAGVSAVMCSYNLVKCTSGLCNAGQAYACANDDILNKHLKQVMGFKGIVMSDWDATKCRDEAANSGGCAPGKYIDNDYAAKSGLDLEMPACMTFKGGATVRAKEKAVRMHWAYLVQGRSFGDAKTGENKGWFAPGTAPQRRLEKSFCCWWPEASSNDVCSRCTSKDLTASQEHCSHKGTWCGPDSPSAPTQASAKADSSLHGASGWGAADVGWSLAGPVGLHVGKLLDNIAGMVGPSHGAAASSPAASPSQPTTTPTPPPPVAPAPVPTEPVAPEPASGATGASKVPLPPPRTHAPLPSLCPDQGGDNYKSPCKLMLARRIIAKSTVVLKNEDGVLPLSKQTAVALVGKEACAKAPLATGGGSGWNGFACNDVPKINVRNGIAGLAGGPKLRCPDDGHGLDGGNSLAETADVILVVVTPAQAVEGSDRASLQLFPADRILIQRYSSMGKKVVVVINAPGPMITSPWDGGVAALLISWLPGQQNGKGIAMALYGAQAPQGRLPVTFPKCNTETCSHADELDSVALGNQIESKAYRTLSDKALIGYRWYHANQRAVSFPFGFGLVLYGSVQIRYSDAQVSHTSEGVRVSCRLEHSGLRPGRDTPQLYLSFPDSVPGDAAIRPAWVLKGFQKTLVHPNKPATATFPLFWRDLSYWDDAPGQSKWVCASGQFRACVGANSRDAVGAEGACTTFTASCP